MPMNELATQKLFKGLTCAYTGMPVTVRVVAAGALQPMFFSPDAFDPALPRPSLEELLKEAGRRNGVYGIKSGGTELECPYTGRRMTVVKTAAGFYLRGGFSPSKPMRDPCAFNAAMRTRGGVPAEVPQASPAVMFPGPGAIPQGPAPSPKNASLEFAESILAKTAAKKTVVTVSRKVPSKTAKG